MIFVKNTGVIAKKMLKRKVIIKKADNKKDKF